MDTEEVQLLMREVEALEAVAAGRPVHPFAVHLTLAKLDALIEWAAHRERQVSQLGHRILLAALAARARECRRRLERTGQGDP